MQITLNGETRTLERSDARVVDALGLLRLDPAARGVAVAVEGTVVPRGLWRETALRDGQRVEILTAAQGG
jgi:sulfur carrier protein